MQATRQIRAEEEDLIVFMLKKLGVDPADYPIKKAVYEYEGGIMGSISFALDESHEYAGDLIQLEYTDVDHVPVIITLTKDSNDQLLDLDFWKEDFSKLIAYPKPENVIVKK